MSVQFTSDVERKRMEKRTLKTTWEFYTGDSLVTAVRTARDMGWKDNKVQVRFEKNEDNIPIYYVEPYEKNCGCRGILKYKDYFG